MTRRRLAAAVALGVALYAGALVLVVTGEPREPQTLNLFALVLVAGLVFTVTGAIAAWRRPNNRTGAQMLAVGLLWSLGALQATNTSLPFTLGFVLSGLAFAAFAHLILSYPTGLLRREDRPLVWAVLGLVTLGPLAITLVDPSPIPTCENCPGERLPRRRPAGADPGGDRGAALAAGGRHGLRRATRAPLSAGDSPLRRVLGPVYLVTLVALVDLVASGVVGTVDASAGLVVELVAICSLALMPIAFLAGILRTRLARAGIADLVIALGNGTPLKAALADALGDPSLDLAYWSPQRQGWVDDEGRTLSEPIARGRTQRRSSSTAASVSPRCSTIGASRTSASWSTRWPRRRRWLSRRSVSRPSSGRSTASSRRSSTRRRACSRSSTRRAGSGTSTEPWRWRAASTTGT